MYRTYNARPVPRPARPRSRKKVWIVYALLVLLIAGAYVSYGLLRPLGAAKTTLLPPVVPGQAEVALPWPEVGQAAIGAYGYGLLATNKEQKPIPMASVAKVITALSILEKMPLRPGETGPMITLTEKDVALYNQYAAKDGSVVPVSAGGQISQYQALQAMMLPSANNIADTTAIWAFGSLEAYTAYANTLVKKLGMTQTTVSDASGFSPATVSTARDLIRLGDAALGHPVLAEIVGQKTAIFPSYGTISNVNNLLGQSGIRGIKTGNTEEAGGCYLAAADIVVNGEKITVIIAIMGSTSRPQAMRDSLPLIQASKAQFTKVNVVQSGQPVGYINTPWGSRSEVVAKDTIAVTAWAGTPLSLKASPASLPGIAPGGTSAGSLALEYRGKTIRTLVETRQALAAPSWQWRLTHPF